MLNEAVLRLGWKSVQGMQREGEGGVCVCGGGGGAITLMSDFLCGWEPIQTGLNWVPHSTDGKRGGGFVVCLMFLLSFPRWVWKCVGIEVTHSLTHSLPPSLLLHLNISTVGPSVELGRMSHSEPSRLILICLSEIAHLRCLFVPSRTEFLSHFGAVI